MKKYNQKFSISLFLLTTIISFLIHNSNFGEEVMLEKGSIKGTFLEHGKPCSLRINLHNADNKLFLKYAFSDSSGIFSFQNLDFGNYYLITHPADRGAEMPLQWRTTEIRLNSTNPECLLNPIEGWSVNILNPEDGKEFSEEDIQNDLTSGFQWTAYDGKAQYEIEIKDIYDQQICNSGKISKKSFLFKDCFADTNKLKTKVYRWSLKVYPNDNKWYGESNFYDFSFGELCSHTIFEANHVKLDFPKWYSSVIQEFDLLTVLDKCYLLEKELNAGQVPVLGPKIGEKQEFFYDSKIMFAHSGQPIHLGKKFISGDDISFMILLHEMAHNFQIGGLPGFPKLLLDENLDNSNSGFCFSEGLATLAAMYAAEMLQPVDLNPRMHKDINSARIEMRAKFYEALKSYEESGDKFENLTPDVVDGILYLLGDTYGWDIFPRFFRIFQENDNTKQIYEQVKAQELRSMSVIICALSTTCKKNLVDDFVNWGFPVDDQFYGEISPLMGEIIL